MGKHDEAALHRCFAPTPVAHDTAVRERNNIEGMTKMLGWLARKSEAAQTARELYGRVVTAARQPHLYRDFGIADTPGGRFEMIALHLFLALEALRGPGKSEPSDNDAARMTIEAFVADMDDSLREMGVGDLTVPKKVKRAAAGFYQRSVDYRTALAAEDDQSLIAALSKHVWTGSGGASQAAALAAYVRSTSASLAGKNGRNIFDQSAWASADFL